MPTPNKNKKKIQHLEETPSPEVLRSIMSSAPVIGNLEDIQLTSSEETRLKPKEVIVKEPVKPQEKFDYRKFKSSVTKDDDALTAFRKYVQSPVFEERVKNQFKNDDYANFFINHAKNKGKRFNVVNGNKSSISQYTKNGHVYSSNQIKYAPDGYSYLLDRFNGIVSHEAGHGIYPGTYNKTPEFYNHLNPNYKNNLNINLTGKPQQERVYGVDRFGNLPVDAAHDQDLVEKIPFIYEGREDMRKAGIWDYTTGAPLTKEAYQKYKKLNPNSRIGNYYNDDNAIYLYNNTASNNTKSPYKLDDQRYFGKYGLRFL